MGNRFIASPRPLHRDLGRVGESLHCFTPFRFIAIWGGEGNRFIASLRSAPSRFGEGEGNRFIASLRSASSRFGEGREIASLLHSVPLHRDLGRVGESLHCFTPFRSIAIWGGEGNRFIASLRSAPSRFGEGEGNRFIASLRSASSRFGEGREIASLLHSVSLHRDLGKGRGRGGESLKSSLGNQVQLYPHMEAVCWYLIWKPSTSQKETSPLAHFVRNSLPHKSFRFCSPMRITRKPCAGTPIPYTTQSAAWLKPYIDFNPQLRAQAKNDFEIDFFKLMNKSVFGKMMENIRKHKDIKLITIAKDCLKNVMKANFKSGVLFSENLMGCEMGKTKVMMNKPVYLSQAILDLSKIVMYEFHYDYMLPKYA